MKRKLGPSEVILTLLLAWVVVYPLVIVAREAAGADWRALIREPSEWRALWNSLWISAASVALSALIGVPLAF
ncbi:MAG TPA: hypothetical protein VGI92_10790, partial [Gemmatimonadales bacterium]